jgi:hypothetical protein
MPATTWRAKLQQRQRLPLLHPRKKDPFSQAWSPGHHHPLDSVSCCMLRSSKEKMILL